MKSQMTVGKRIALTAAMLIVFTISVGAVAVVSMNRIEVANQAVVGDALPGVYSISRAESLAKEIEASMLMHIGSDSQEHMAQLESNIAESRRAFDRILGNYEKTITRREDRALFDRITPAFERFMGAWEAPRALSRAVKTQEALAAFCNQTQPVFSEFLKTVTDEVDFNKKSADEFSSNATSSNAAGRFWTWAILLVAVASGCAVSLFVTAGINKVLKRSVAEIGQGAEQVASAASQISSASQALAQGSSEEAASLEEVSASSEEINSMARKNTENSQAASQEMGNTEQIVAEANNRLDEMVTSMAAITESSNKISKIIKVIDEIAFQTNILALNAAVEAARAGEAGMGFAVVAEEVRNLAQRSAQAAKDTAALIEESIEKSRVGGQHLDLVAEGVKKITSGAKTVKRLVDDVNHGSQEQAQGTEQVARSIADMQQVTQRTAATAEESASAAEELTGQSEMLREIVARLNALVGAQTAARTHDAPKPTPRISEAAAPAPMRQASFVHNSKDF
jgi:methyl-accepting chemotaxis protein